MDLGHVEGLKNLTLVGGTVSVVRNANTTGLQLLLAPSDTSSNRNLGSNDTVSSVEVGGRVIHMHRSTLSLGATSPLARQLSKYRLDISLATSCYHVSMATVGSDDMVLRCELRLDTRSYSLLVNSSEVEVYSVTYLAVVKMQEASNQLLLVSNVSSNFESPHEGHLTEEAQKFFSVGLCLHGGPSISNVMKCIRHLQDD